MISCAAAAATVIAKKTSTSNARALPLLQAVAEMAEISLFACRCRRLYADPLIIRDIFACKERACAGMHGDQVLRCGNGRGETVLMF